MSLNIVDQEVRKVDSSQDLLLCVENLEGKEQKPSVFETAALQLTMHQIGAGWKVLSRENYRENDDILLYLATESIKETVSKGWKKFVESLKVFFKKITEKITNLIGKIKALFKGKGGSGKSSKVEEVDEEGNSVKRTKGEGQAKEDEFTEEEESDLVKKLNSGKVSKQLGFSNSNAKALPGAGESSGSRQLKRTEESNKDLRKTWTGRKDEVTGDSGFGERYFKVPAAHFSFGDKTGVDAYMDLSLKLVHLDGIRDVTQQRLFDDKMVSMVSGELDDWNNYLSEISNQNLENFRKLGKVEEKGNEYVVRLSPQLQIVMNKFDPAIGKVSVPKMVMDLSERIIIPIDNTTEMAEIAEIADGMAAHMDSKGVAPSRKAFDNIFEAKLTESPVVQERIMRLGVCFSNLSTLAFLIMDFVDSFAAVYAIISKDVWKNK